VVESGLSGICYRVFLIPDGRRVRFCITDFFMEIAPVQLGGLGLGTCLGTFAFQQLDQWIRNKAIDNTECFPFRELFVTLQDSLKWITSRFNNRPDIKNVVYFQIRQPVRATIGYL